MRLSAVNLVAPWVAPGATAGVRRRARAEPRGKPAATGGRLAASGRQSLAAKLAPAMLAATRRCLEERPPVATTRRLGVPREVRLPTAAAQRREPRARRQREEARLRQGPGETRAGRPRSTEPWTRRTYRSISWNRRSREPLRFRRRQAGKWTVFKSRHSKSTHQRPATGWSSPWAWWSLSSTLIQSSRDNGLTLARSVRFAACRATPASARRNGCRPRSTR
jgi:hypothetical protein